MYTSVTGLISNYILTVAINAKKKAIQLHVHCSIVSGAVVASNAPRLRSGRKHSIVWRQYEGDEVRDQRGWLLGNTHEEHSFS